MADIPNDSIILLSYVNTKLRDFYQNLDQLCEDMNLNKEDLIAKLASIDYQYDHNLNQFR